MHQSVKTFPKVFSISKLAQIKVKYVVTCYLLSRYRHYSLAAKAIGKVQKTSIWR